MTLWCLAPDLLAELIISKDEKGSFRVCSHRLDKPRRASPEEVIRQLMLAHLRLHYRYPHDRLVSEYPVTMGVARKRADIAILNSSGGVETIIEVKLTINEPAILQLQSYMIATAAGYGAVVSPYDRRIFSKSSDGGFLKLLDLPLYGGDAHIPDALISTATPDESAPDSRVSGLLASLGILKLKRVDGNKSRLYVKNGCITMANTSLLNYSNVRREAIRHGIVLSGAVRDEDWDDALAHLFENVDVVEGSAEDETSEQAAISSFLEAACERIDPDTRTAFKDIYSNFEKWYTCNVANSLRTLPSKKAVSAHLIRNGFLRKNIGGIVYVFGLHVRPQEGLESETCRGRR